MIKTSNKDSTTELMKKIAAIVYKEFPHLQLRKHHLENAIFAVLEENEIKDQKIPRERKCYFCKEEIDALEPQITFNCPHCKKWIDVHLHCMSGTIEGVMCVSKG